MTEDDARQVELVRAIEGEDRDRTLLTHEDVAQAEAHARAASAGANGKTAGGKFIASRAAFASARLATRHPGVGRLLQRSRWPRWLGIMLPVLALAAGFIANEFGNSKRLDLLAVPLLGTIAWNLVVYLWLLAGAFSRKPSQLLHPLSQAIARVRGSSQRQWDPGSPLQRAAQAFESRWANASAPLLGARIARTQTPEGAAAALGGLLSGALGGLTADIAAGGLTLGGGMIVGAILGALGATGLAKGINLARGEEGSGVRWSAEFLERLTVTALLRYLAVAHFGRGRGEWSEGEHPAFWQSVVEGAVAEHRNELAQVLKSAGGSEGNSDALPELPRLLRETGSAILERLYPGASMSRPG